MFSLTRVLISVAFLSSTVFGLSVTEENITDEVSLNLPVSFRRPLNDDNRVYGGKEAAIGQFPHQVSLRLLKSHICGGSIISDRFVLTAAHCKQPFRFFYSVLVGAHQAKGKDGTAYKVKRWILHENYYMQHTNTSFIVRNDIALIETLKTIEFNKLVAPIALQRKFFDDQIQAVASGWGKTNDQVTSLKFVNVQTLTNAACRLFVGYGSSKSLVHDWDTICATSFKAGHGLCIGDSGGPLASENKLIGIASWVMGCDKNLPNGFTRVSTFVDWISEKTKLPF